MVWNEHDQWLNAQIKIITPSWWEHRMGMCNMPKNR